MLAANNTKTFIVKKKLEASKREVRKRLNIKAPDKRLQIDGIHVYN